jgi:choice-of-anchor B domain-containing protein
MPSHTLSPTCLALAALTVASGAHAGGFSSDKVALHSHISLAEFGAEFAEDCWGYVSATGREYAIVGLSTGTAFVEITDPDNPDVVEIIETPNRGRDMKVYGDYVYTSSDSGPLHIIDVSEIDAGTVTLVTSLPDGATHNLHVNEESGFLYLAIGGPLAMVDLSDPESPTFAGLWDGEAHDVQVVTYTEGKYAGREIAFVYAGRSLTLDIVDVTDKAEPFLVGNTTYDDAAYVHQGWLTEDRRYVYLNDELDDIQRTTIVNVEDLSDPTVVGEFTTGLDSTDHNLYTRDGFIFEANYTSGLRVFDACDPVDPVEVGYFDTFPSDDAPGYDGAWSCYPYFPSETVIVTDRSGGLFVLDTSEAVGSGCGTPCTGDIDGNDVVDTADLVALLAAWGPCPGCPADLDGNDVVDTADLVALLAAWGPCP